MAAAALVNQTVVTFCIWDKPNPACQVCTTTFRVQTCPSSVEEYENTFLVTSVGQRQSVQSRLDILGTVNIRKKHVLGWRGSFLRVPSGGANPPNLHETFSTRLSIVSDDCQVAFVTKPGNENW